MNKFFNLLIAAAVYYILISIIINQNCRFTKERAFLYHLYIKYIYS